MAHRWIKHSKQTGLAAVGAFPRGAVMTDTITGETYMGLHPLDRSGTQWKYTIYRSTGNLSSKATFASYDEAKVAADARWKAGKEQLIALRIQWNGLFGCWPRQPKLSSSMIKD